MKDEGNQIGVAVNPATPLSAVEEVLPLLDIVLVMSVNPGYGGQAYIPASVDKVKRLKEILDGGGHGAQIEVDGGVKADWTAEESVKAGATILVSGNGYLQQRPDDSAGHGQHALLHRRGVEQADPIGGRRTGGIPSVSETRG